MGVIPWGGYQATFRIVIKGRFGLWRGGRQGDPPGAPRTSTATGPEARPREGLGCQVSAAAAAEKGSID